MFAENYWVAGAMESSCKAGSGILSWFVQLQCLCSFFFYVASVSSLKKYHNKYCTLAITLLLILYTSSDVEHYKSMQYYFWRSPVRDYVTRCSYQCCCCHAHLQEPGNPQTLGRLWTNYKTPLLRHHLAVDVMACLNGVPNPSPPPCSPDICWLATFARS